MADKPTMVICSWCLAQYRYKSSGDTSNPPWIKSTRDEVASLLAEHKADGGGESHGCCTDCAPALKEAAAAAAQKKRDELAGKKKPDEPKTA